MQQDSGAKEATILSLAQDIQAILNSFQETLDNHFQRGVKTEGECSARPENPNVLDEIIGRLNDSKAHLTRIVSFISSDVLPKIS